MKLSEMTDEEFFKLYEAHQDEMEKELLEENPPKKLIKKDDKP